MAKIKHTRNENGQNFTHQNKTTLFWRKKAKINLHQNFPIYGIPVSSNDGVNLLVFAWWFQQWSIFALGWQLLSERYWCLSVGLKYKSVVMLPSLTVVVVSRKDILLFDTSCVNFIDGWILLACSKNSSSSLSLCIHFMSTSSINQNHERGCLSDERSNHSSRSPIKMLA